MGGIGSGRWTLHSKKQTVADCLVLTVDKLVRGRLHTTGTLAWTNTATGEQDFTCSYELSTLDPSAAWIRLFYNVSGTGEEVDYAIRLTATRPHFGGIRWWFACPLVEDAQPCNRRVRKLYLPPGARYFGCRNCYRLTYRSAQEHDKRVDDLLRLPLEDLRQALFNEVESKPFLAIKASSRLLKRVGNWKGEPVADRRRVGVYIVGIDDPMNDHVVDPHHRWREKAFFPLS